MSDVQRAQRQSPAAGPSEAGSAPPPSFLFLDAHSVLGGPGVEAFLAADLLCDLPVPFLGSALPVGDLSVALSLA